MTSSPAPEEAIRLLARIAEMHSDQAPDSLVLWCDNARQPETILTLGHARVIAAWNRRAGGERERELEAENERLRRIEKAARAYYRGYCQDEAEERNLCISDRHHADAQELRDALVAELDARAALAGQTEGERNG